MFYTESVKLGPRFIPQSVMLSLHFIPESLFYTQSVVRSPQSVKWASLVTQLKMADKTSTLKWTKLVG